MKEFTFEAKLMPKLIEKVGPKQAERARTDFAFCRIASS